MTSHEPIGIFDGARLVYLYGISGSRIRTGDHFEPGHAAEGAVDVHIK